MNGGWAENEGVIQAAQQQIDFINAGYLADGAPDEYPASQNKIGLTGEVAMVVCANYVASEVNNNTGTEINWGMFNYPEVEGGADPSNAYAGSNAIGITSYTENAQAAFDFAMFLVTGEYDQKMADTASHTLNELRKKIRATENAIRDRLDSLVHNMESSKYLQEAVVSIRNGRVRNRVIVTKRLRKRSIEAPADRKTARSRFFHRHRKGFLLPQRMRRDETDIRTS